MRLLVFSLLLLLGKQTYSKIFDSLHYEMGLNLGQHVKLRLIKLMSSIVNIKLFKGFESLHIDSFDKCSVRAEEKEKFHSECPYRIAISFGNTSSNLRSNHSINHLPPESFRINTHWERNTLYIRF